MFSIRSERLKLTVVTQNEKEKNQDFSKTFWNMAPSLTGVLSTISV